MLIKPVTKTLFDVFLDDGWENWTRFERSMNNGKTFLRKISGKNVPPQVMATLRKHNVKE